MNAPAAVSWTELRTALSVRSAINGKVCSGDVGGLRTGDERYQRGNLIDMSVTIERRDCLLRCCPIARGGY